jgi:hypothetical protein
MPTTSPTILNQITAEKTKLSERLAASDADRAEAAVESAAHRMREGDDRAASYIVRAFGRSQDARRAMRRSSDGSRDAFLLALRRYHIGLFTGIVISV